MTHSPTQPHLSGPYLCYLSEGAKRAVGALIAFGLDLDLALAVLEQLWPEEEIYDIPER